jgi:hypothetical protein
MAPSHLRWIVLASDGRHSTLERDTAPDDAALAAAGAALVNLELAGWLVRLEGDYWARRKPAVLTMIQPLTHAADADWPAAVAAFEAIRIAATSSKFRSSPSRMAGCSSPSLAAEQ